MRGEKPAFLRPAGCTSCESAFQPQGLRDGLAWEAPAPGLGLKRLPEALPGLSAQSRSWLPGKNCLDKPRFGGPGVKKKACVNRVCLNADASPQLRPTACKDTVPSLEGLPDGLTRHPLLPLDSPPLTAVNLYSAPTPSTEAATNRSKLELLLASHGINLYNR